MREAISRIELKRHYEIRSQELIYQNDSRPGKEADEKIFLILDNIGSHEFHLGESSIIGRRRKV